jgi:putative transposon-encoded protein
LSQEQKEKNGGAKIDCPKRYLGKKAIVIIREKD